MQRSARPRCAPCLECLNPVIMIADVLRRQRSLVNSFLPEDCMPAASRMTATASARPRASSACRKHRRPYGRRECDRAKNKSPTLRCLRQSGLQTPFWLLNRRCDGDGAEHARPGGGLKAWRFSFRERCGAVALADSTMRGCRIEDPDCPRSRRLLVADTRFFFEKGGRETRLHPTIRG